MSVRHIVCYPDPRLREPSKAATVFGEPLRALVADMTDTMYDAEGAGLAAIQVGEPVRLFIVDGPIAGGPEGSPPIAFVNPELIDLSTESQTGDEGCLSFPGIFAPVKRAERVRVKAFDLDGKPFEREGNALFARALQHEMDHLNGRLLIDNVGPVKREIIKRKMRKEAKEAKEAKDNDSKDVKPADRSPEGLTDGIEPTRTARETGKASPPRPAAKRRAAGDGSPT